MGTSTILLASVGAAIMGAALIYQSILTGTGPSLRWWGIGVILLLTHPVAAHALSQITAVSTFAIIIIEVLHLTGGLLLLGGTRLFCGIQPSIRWGIGCLGACVVWLLVATQLGFPVQISVFPTHLLVGALAVLSALQIVSAGHLRQMHSAYLLVALVGWAVAIILFPPLSERHEWATDLMTLDILGSQAFGTAVALGLLVVAMRRQSDEIDAARRMALASQQSAAEQADQFRCILDVMPDVVISINGDGLVEEFNPAAEQVFGYRAVQILGKTLDTLFSGFDPRAYRQDASCQTGHVDDVSAASAVHQDEAGQDEQQDDSISVKSSAPSRSPLVWSCETIGQRSDGTPVILDVTVSVTERPTGTLYVMVARDVSEARLNGQLGEFLHRLDQKALQAPGTAEFVREVCGDLADIFEIPLVVVLDRVDRRTLQFRAAGGEAASDAIRTTVNQLVAQGGGACSALLEALRTGSVNVVQKGDMRAGGLLSAAGPEIDWAVVLPLWSPQDVSALVLIFGQGQVPDVTILRRLETAVARLGAVQQQVADQQRLRLQSTAMAAAANAIFITDRDGAIEWVNDAFTRLSGYSEDEAIGSTPSFLKSGAQDTEVYRRLWETIANGSVWRGEMVERRKDGTLYTVDQTVAPILDEQGEVAHFVAIHEDVTERKRAEERILYLSNYDTLTRLPNRVLFRDHLYQAVTKARNDHSALAVMFIDLDRFSRVNDTLGHEIGDQLLMTVASRINAVAAPYAETVARIGGDEFAVIQSHLSNADTAASLARKIIDEVAKPVDLDGIDVRVGANVGIAIFPQDGEDPDHIIKNADMAMYRAIRSESESYCFFSNDMNAEARIRLSLEGDLRRALDNGDLTLFFQPQVSVKTRHVVGVEALLRWNHPDQGAISPARFIPVAEDSGLILPIGDWVLEQAMRQRQSWSEMGLPPVTMAINISAVQFRQQGLVRKIRQIAEHTGIDPHQIELELTESMLMQDAREAVTVLSELSEMGALLAIDDFGTGYSSLSYLKQFPVDKLKLDQSFVRHMTTEHNDAVIARATINLGHSLGLEVIAEGVETDEQYAYLWAEGCDVIQGYLFGRPMDAHGLEGLLKAQQASDSGDAFAHIPLPGGGS